MTLFVFLKKMTLSIQARSLIFLVVFKNDLRSLITRETP